jgi:monooxygenase
LLHYMRARGVAQCVPRNLDGAPAEDGAVFALTSGYVQRSAHLLPKQGSRQPWRVYHSYLRDYRALKMGAIEDGVMQFSSPVPPAGSVSSVGSSSSASSASSVEPSPSAVRGDAPATAAVST